MLYRISKDNARPDVNDPEEAEDVSYRIFGESLQLDEPLVLANSALLHRSYASLFDAGYLLLPV